MLSSSFQNRTNRCLLNRWRCAGVPDVDLVHQYRYKMEERTFVVPKFIVIEVISLYTISL